MTSALIVFYIFIAVLLILFVLLQDPKGGGGALFGGGGSQSLFGATGATSFIVKATRFIAVLFAICVVSLNFILIGDNSSKLLNSDVKIEQPVLGDEPIETETSLKATPTNTKPKVEQVEKNNNTDKGEKP